MRIAIVGAGAVGGVIAGSLLESGGHEVAVVARGAHLAAIRRDGLTVIRPSHRVVGRPIATDDPRTLGLQDLVIVSLKGHGLPAVAPRLPPLLSPSTIVICAQNGIPWWFLKGLDAPERDQPLEVVDPGGGVWRALSAARNLGCVISLPAAVRGPGVVEHQAEMRRLVLGPPQAGADEDALTTSVQVLREAGLDASPTPDIRTALWRKLALNVVFGPVGVLTGAGVGAIEAARELFDARERLVQECAAVAHAWGSDIAADVPRLLAPGAGPAHHKSSMLQDHEAGRVLEIDPILTAVTDLARRRSVSVPMIALLLGLVKLKIDAT